MLVGALLGLMMAHSGAAQYHGFIGFGPDPATPGPTNNNFYIRVFLNNGVTTQAAFESSFFSKAMKAQTYYKTVPAQAYFPTGSYINSCMGIWGDGDLQVSYRDKTYGIIDDPGRDLSGLTIYTDTSRLISVNRVRECDQGVSCPGCNLNNAASSLGFFVTSDDNSRTIFAYGVCRAWVQDDCTKLTTCNNGQYATNFRIKDTLTLLTLYPITCMPCKPGTWNTCNSPTTSCSWCVMLLESEG
jgi:hypothetical protein